MAPSGGSIRAFGPQHVSSVAVTRPASATSGNTKARMLVRKT
ncbi:hypothetical protein PF003_g7069 [Phytophthora fragariae]|nr:hypothetical protein PF003_g7069 [Phytophthora fragariae]